MKKTHLLHQYRATRRCRLCGRV